MSTGVTCQKQEAAAKAGAKTGMGGGGGGVGLHHASSNPASEVAARGPSVGK